MSGFSWQAPTLALALASAPKAFDAANIRALKNAGLTQIEILDLVQSVALFAWAHRLMLNLGGPVAPETPPL